MYKVERQRATWRVSRFALAVSSACAICFQTACPKANHNMAKPPVPTPDRIETRVYLRSQCLLGEEQVLEPPKAIVGALAAIFIPLLIEKGLGAVSSALKRAGSEETLRDSGKFPTYLYRLSFDAAEKGHLSLNPDLGCAILVRGKFSGPDPSDQSKVSFPETGLLVGPKEEEKRIARLNASGIPVKELVAEYEAAIKRADDNTALGYESRFLEMSGFQGSRSSDSRAVVVGFTFVGVGAKEDESTLSLALIQLGEVKQGTVLGPGQLRSRRSGWLGGVAATDESLKAAEKLPAIPGKYYGIMPATFEGTLVETEKGSKALLFIADVLDSAKSEAAKAISSAVLPAEREKAAKEKADALEKQREEEEDAYGKYLAASDEQAQLKPDASDSTKAIKQFNVESTKRIWCLKFSTLQKLGIAPARRPSCP